jgi:hypothetical protein
MFESFPFLLDVFDFKEIMIEERRLTNHGFAPLRLCEKNREKRYIEVIFCIMV